MKGEQRMSLDGIRIGFCMTGSFCTFEKAFAAAERLVQEGAKLVPIMSFNAASISTRFVDMAMTTGRAFLRWLFTAMVAGVSVKPRASFAAVFEVQGATTMISHIFLGPIGSASSMVRMTLCNLLYNKSKLCSHSRKKFFFPPLLFM